MSLSSQPSRFVRFARFVSRVVACIACVACSTTGDDAPSKETSGIRPVTPERNPQPPSTPQPIPVAPEADGGAGSDGGDSCARTAPSNQCGLVPQCGCTLAETCDVEDGIGNVACVTAGRAPMGAACVVTAGCARGLTCVFGTCHAFCNAPGAACAMPNTGACVQPRGAGDVTLPNLVICRVACDLRDVNGCGGTTTAGTGVCIDDGVGGTDCVRGGTRAVTQTCTPTEECGPGLVCATSGGAPVATCKRWCRVGTSDCGGAVTCNGFQPKVLVGTVEHGVCG